MKYVLVIEGQETPLDESIAANDDVLRTTIAAYMPPASKCRNSTPNRGRYGTHSKGMTRYWCEKKTWYALDKAGTGGEIGSWV